MNFRSAVPPDARAGDLRRTVAWSQAHAAPAAGGYVAACTTAMVLLVIAGGWMTLAVAVPVLVFLPLVLGVFPGDAALISRYERSDD